MGDNSLEKGAAVSSQHSAPEDEGAGLVKESLTVPTTDAEDWFNWSPEGHSLQAGQLQKV